MWINVRAKRSGRSGGTALVNGNDRQSMLKGTNGDGESDGTKPMPGLDLRVTE